MITYIFKRILLFIPTLLAITLISLAIAHLAPGDPGDSKIQAGGDRDPNKAKTGEMVKKWKAEMGLDKPILEQYVNWVGKIVQLDFGKSFDDGRPVMEKIAERLPVTILMNLFSILIAYLVAIPIGVKASTKPGSFFDRSTGTTLFMMYSLPSFWIATLTIIFLCSSEYLQIFPESGMRSMEYNDSWSLFQKAGDILWHITLPLIIYSYSSLAFLSRQMRSSMLDVVRQDYIRTARAKGLAERIVVWKHALRNSLIPIITILAGLLPGLLGGSFIVETIFGIPGIGQLGLQALNSRDYNTIMAELVLGAVLTLLGILIADILYAVVDPRIAFDKKSS